ATATACRLAGARILVYERNTFARRAIRNRLLAWGASVFISGRWVDMLNMLDTASREKKPYDLVVLGLSVQEYGGRLVTEILEDVRQHGEMPILLLIGAEAQELATDKLGHERVRLISKPLRSERMLRAIHALLPDAADAGQTSPPPLDVAAGTDSGQLAGLEVLVAEDNEFNQGLIMRLLQGMGVSVTLATDGKQACNAATAHSFDLILMDIHMPEIGGIEACNTIRTSRNRTTPVVALSADVFACEQQLDEGLMQDCITKPVTARKLADILQKWAVQGPRDDASEQHWGVEGTGSLPAGMEVQLHEDLVMQLSKLRSACMADDAAAIEDHLHQLKGIADYFQLAEFRAGCDSLYQAAAANDRQAMIRGLDRLNALLANGDG
ncbi:MAG: response regulator, partial [Thiohalobacterales bacterium]|nr:response regulator [Thiohalobacterales bacterium]